MNANSQDGERPAFQRVGILGGGAWGTALAQSARRAGRDITLWAYEFETVSEINSHHTNRVYLPGVVLIGHTQRAADADACRLDYLICKTRDVVQNFKLGQIHPAFFAVVLPGAGEVEREAWHPGQFHRDLPEAVKKKAVGRKSGPFYRLEFQVGIFDKLVREGLVAEFFDDDRDIGLK